ncbi:MAG: HAMP domain-containing histidine kinase, partial [Bacteroidia bacterium]|nr:HAMP domain-containing histidine kinase [Bacteroidia bacterium]
MENQLREALTSKDKIFSIIVHDLKTPLNGIIGFSELLIQEMKKPECMNLCEKNFNYLKILNSSCYKMLELIKNLETWSRLQNGFMTCCPVIIDLSKIVNDNIELMEVFARNKEIKLISGIQKKVNVFADFQMLNIVIRNILSNALKFTGKNGKVEITYKTLDDKIIICVSDNGTGIPPEQIKYLFDKNQFVQTKGTANEEGTGLGLKLC